MNVEMGFKVGIANHVVEGERFGADNVAKVGVNHAAINAALKPEFDQRHHGVGFTAVAGEAADEVAALLGIGTVGGDEASDWSVV